MRFCLILLSLSPLRSNFLSEEIEKSLRVSPLISMPVKDLHDKKKKGARSAKKGWHRSNTL